MPRSVGNPDLKLVSWHGLTTALLGKCGVTFALCKPSDRELLAGMLFETDRSMIELGLVKPAVR